MEGGERSALAEAFALAEARLAKLDETYALAESDLAQRLGDASGDASGGSSGDSGRAAAEGGRTLARLGDERATLALRASHLRAALGAEQAVAEAEASGDGELRALAAEELALALAALAEMDAALAPAESDARGAILELRAAAGGDEAALFTALLERMYRGYAEAAGWSFETLDATPSDLGGLRDGVFRIRGAGALAGFRFESGVHRVQRVPTTETAGRIHTSTATAAVLPEATEAECVLRAEDLRVDTYRASGAGGQHVNRTDSAVRITHLPSGIVAQCQDEKSQHRNRARALAVLRARILAQEQANAARGEHALRRSQIGSGERGERIRTYNFPQNRLTDHRFGFSLRRLREVMEGPDLAEVVAACKAAEAAEATEAREAREADDLGTEHV